MDLEVPPAQQRFLKRFVEIVLFLLCLIVAFLLVQQGLQWWRKKAEADAVAAMPKTYRMQVVHFSFWLKPGHTKPKEIACAGPFSPPGYLATVREWEKSLPMTLDDPKAFMTFLRQKMPDYEMRLIPKATCDSDAQGNCTVVGGPHKDDPEQHQQKNIFHLTPTKPGTYEGGLETGTRSYTFENGRITGDPWPEIGPRNRNFSRDFRVNTTRWLWVSNPQKTHDERGEIQNITAACLISR